MPKKTVRKKAVKAARPAGWASTVASWFQRGVKAGKTGAHTSAQAAWSKTRKPKRDFEAIRALWDAYTSGYKRGALDRKPAPRKRNPAAEWISVKRVRIVRDEAGRAVRLDIER